MTSNLNGYQAIVCVVRQKGTLSLYQVSLKKTCGDLDASTQALPITSPPPVRLHSSVFAKAALIFIYR